MSENVIGICEEVINNGKGKGSGIRVNGLKYGVYDPNDANLDEVTAGTTVSFRFKAAEKGGTLYKNIQGKITTVKDGTPLTAAPAPEAASASTGGSTRRYRNNGEEGGFPIHAKAYERALDRRNALNAAVALVAYMPLHQNTEEVLAIAREFEAYTTGSADAEAEKKMAFINDALDD